MTNLTKKMLEKILTMHHAKSLNDNQEDCLAINRTFLKSINNKIGIRAVHHYGEKNWEISLNENGLKAINIYSNNWTRIINFEALEQCLDILKHHNFDCLIEAVKIHKRFKILESDLKTKESDKPVKVKKI